MATSHVVTAPPSQPVSAEQPDGVVIAVLLEHQGCPGHQGHRLRLHCLRRSSGRPINPSSLTLQPVAGHPHIAAATICLPLILITFFLSLTGRFPTHRKVARWTFPLWLYVSVTGVITWAMLRLAMSR